MAEQIPTDEEKRLADRLKLEARATRPVFSEALHARVCQALRHSEVRVQRGGVPSWLRYRWLPLAIAATLLVSVSLLAWWLSGLSGPGSRSPGPGTEIAESPGLVADPDMITGPTARTAEQVAVMLDPTVSDGKWAYLDHDAQVALQLLKDQLPFDVASID